MACKPAFNTFYTSHLRYTVLCGAVLFVCFFIIQTSDRKQFFTVLQDKLHSFKIQHALPLHNKYRIDHIIKRFHEENSIISGLFKDNNLLLCGMQCNDGLLAKKKIQNHLYTASQFSRLTSVDEFEMNCIYSRSEARFQGNNIPIFLRLHRILQIP